MMHPVRYRMPSGAEIVSIDGSMVTMQVTMPADDAGHIGRHCPKCRKVFRLHVEDYQAQPDDQILTCPYCCSVGGHSDFFTKQQADRANEAASAYAVQLMEDQLGKALGRMVRSGNSGNGTVRMSLSRSTGATIPRSLPPIREEVPIRERTCGRCAVRYSVFGEHIACPACGRLQAKTVAIDGLDAQDALLAVFDQLPSDVRDQLREGGALERSAAGALGSVVSIVEAYLKTTFLDRVAGGDAIIAGRGNVFQRLDDAASLFRDHLGLDLPAVVGAPGWDRLLTLYGIRHLLTHNNGIVDAKHVARFPGHGHVVGERVSVSVADAQGAISLARTIISGA